MHLHRRFVLAAADGSSTEGASGGGGAAAPAPPAPPPAAPPSTPASGAGDAEPHWLKPRLEQARSSLLKELGVDSLDAAKAAVAAAKAEADSKKTAEQRAAELQAKLDAEAAERARQGSIIAEHAGRMLMGLTPEQQAAVKAIAGDDAAAQLKTIGALQPTWAKERDAAAAAAPGTATTQQQTATPPATTTTAPNAPNGTTTSPPNHRTAYLALRETNPFAAAAYAEQHPEAYGAAG